MAWVWKNLRSKFFERDASLGIIDDTVGENAGADDDPLTRNFAGDALHVRAFAPVDHIDRDFFESTISTIKARRDSQQGGHIG